AVVAAAGNDATVEPMFPAGFAVRPDDPDAVPLVSVGALNPDHGTIAYFSNDGPWVRCRRPGAALVSTMPRTFQGPLQAIAANEPPGLAARATVDIDDYSGGFGIWSGTSFAAPILAAQVARRLVDTPDLADVSVAAMVRRGQKAVAAELAEDG
ncbi:MAG TPA: S8 family serine peptidase, partial [Euzebya sp.]|nr:S8 family serine peptidase [Euzebya sp.]